MSVRAFIAVEISNEARENIGKLQTELKRFSSEPRWVSPSDMHITLVFLGEVSEDAIGLITTEMDAVGAQACPFTYEISGLGFFGRPQSPRVIWAGARGNVQPLVEMQARLALTAKELGVDVDDRPYSPHLTLARLKFPKHVERLMAELDRRKNETFGAVSVNRILLLKSQLGTRDERYVIIHETPLISS